MPVESGTKNSAHKFKPNVVEVVDHEYIDKIFKTTNPVDNDIINSTITDYLLNSEQERAFCIIANHTTVKNPTKLHMYLGGMGCELHG